MLGFGPKVTEYEEFYALKISNDIGMPVNVKSPGALIEFGLWKFTIQEKKFDLRKFLGSGNTLDSRRCLISDLGKNEMEEVLWRLKGVTNSGLLRVYQAACKGIAPTKAQGIHFHISNN